MTPNRAQHWLALVLLVGALARFAAWLWAPPLFPDAYFQYLEPAWQRLSGVGLQAWEWRDGIRSWVLPGYHGAWMAVLSGLGIRGSSIGRVIQLHWAALSLFMVWAAYRGGASMARQTEMRLLASRFRSNPGEILWPSNGRHVGLFVAFLVASHPVLCLNSFETLTELPSMIGLVSGLCLTAELVENGDGASGDRSFAIGVLLSVAVCLRIVNAPLAMMAPLWLWISGPRRMILPMAYGAILPITLFGVVDRLTWGQYFSSFIAYFKFNFIEGRAVQFGKQPARWYWDMALIRHPIGMWGLGACALLGIRTSWPFVVGATGMFALMSTQAHKEERFMIVLWPLLLIAAGVTAGRWLRPLALPRPGDSAQWSKLRIHWHASRAVAVIVASLLLAWEGLKTQGHREFPMSQARFEGQTWVGQQAGATGLLTDWPLYFGGYLWLDRSFPMMSYADALLENPVFTHVLVPRGSTAARSAMARGFSEIWNRDEMVILARPSSW